MRILSLTAAIMLLCGPAFAQSPSFTERAKSRVRDNLRDPASATFRGLVVRPGVGVCGEVNAKNGYGGYTGYQRFAWSSKDSGVVFADDESPEDYITHGVRIAHLFDSIGCKGVFGMYLDPWYKQFEIPGPDGRLADGTLSTTPLVEILAKRTIRLKLTLSKDGSERFADVKSLGNFVCGTVTYHNAGTGSDVTEEFVVAKDHDILVVGVPEEISESAVVAGYIGFAAGCRGPLVKRYGNRASVAWLNAREAERGREGLTLLEDLP